MAVVETDLNSTCQGVALSAPVSEQSTGKDDPEAPGWTKVRIHCIVFLAVNIILICLENLIPAWPAAC